MFHLYRDRLTASDMIHIKKVMEHVYEKIVLNDNNSGSSNSDKPQMPPEELSSLAESKIDIRCNDTVRVNEFLGVTFCKYFRIKFL